MARGITVKVTKAKVVKALQAKLDESEKNTKLNEKAEIKYKAELDKYQKGLIKDFAKHLELYSVNTRWNNQIEVTYSVAKGVELPKQPEMERLSTLGAYEIRDIENAIRILEMSDEEFVNASTMKQIAGYL